MATRSLASYNDISEDVPMAPPEQPKQPIERQHDVLRWLDSQGVVGEAVVVSRSKGRAGRGERR